jgi:hypothetical protein
MALELEGQTVTGVRLFGEPREYRDIHLVDVTLKLCVLVRRDDLGFGNVVRNAVLERCRLDACGAQGVFFDEVTVDALRLAQLRPISGCVFRHVTLRGKIGSIMIIGPGLGLPDDAKRVAAAVEKYKEVDWALDIRDAVFTSAAEFFGVPGDLIRRDENTQVLLRREAFAGMDWRDLPGAVGTWSRRFKATPFDSIVVVAPKGSKKFREYMADIEWLHAKGLAG